MKILLINPPGWQKGSTNLGLCYLAGGLLARGYEVKTLDVNATNESPGVVTDRVIDYAPDVIGLSIKTSTANAAFLISTAIKERYDRAVHVVGGPHTTLAYEEVLRENQGIEYAFLGEADISFVDFIERLQDGCPLDEVPGMAWLESGELRTTEREYILDLDSLPDTDFESIEGFSFEDFRYPLITSRGCPYKCTYCCVPVVSSKRWRWRSPEHIFAELDRVKQGYGIESFEILDDNLTLNLNRAKEFCRLLIERNLNMPWYCHNGIRADRIDRELAGLMKKAGCTSVAIGIESGDEKIFDSIMKGEKLESVVEAVKLIKEAGMRAVGYFIIGLPGDSLEGIKKTIKFQQKLGLDNFTYGILNPYPFTEVYDTIRRDGRILMDVKDSSHFSSELSIPFDMPGFSKEDMEKAYYMATFQRLNSVFDGFKTKYGKTPERILYLDFFSSSKFAENLSKLLPTAELDIFTGAKRGHFYSQHKKSAGFSELSVYANPPRMVARVKAFLKWLNLFRKNRYDMVFYNVETPAVLLPALLAIVRPRAFFFESLDGNRLFSLLDRKVLRAGFSAVVSVLPVFMLSLLAYPFLRLLVIGFGFFMYLKRDGKEVEFTPDGPVLTDLD